MTVKPYEEREDSRKEQVRDMFNSIAKDYDFLNHFLSFNTDKRWRRKLVRLIRSELERDKDRNQTVHILDVATGTGDLAFALSKITSSRVTGLDLSEEMLNIARKKSDQKDCRIEWLEGDSERLPFEDAGFDFVTVAFGVRNFENLNLGLSEMARVLKSGGMIFILEFSKPGKGLFSLLYRFYSKKVLPFTASLFTSEPRAYTYLPNSIEAFPSGSEMLSELKKAGLKDGRFWVLSGGIATIYAGRR